MSNWKSIAETAAEVQGGQVKALDLVNKSLDLIDAAREYNAIISTIPDRARQRAAEIDARVSAGEPIGILAGVPFIAKDNFLVFGAETTAASNILKRFQAPYQSTAIEKLEAAGAICVAKANLDAFAHGSSTENSDFMVTKNPHNPEHVPGGSSGGSGAAIALDLVPFALGTDTGGSIRLPASFCGVVGLKPTYGLVSRSGVVAMASSADVVGPFTRTVADSSVVLEVMSGRDPLDGTTIERDSTAYTQLDASLPGKKIGIIKEYMADGIDTAVRDSIDQSIKSLQDAGAEIVEISLPTAPLALAVYYIICTAEVSSNLGRYDGQRFGFSYQNANSLDESFSKTRSLGFGKEAKRRIMLGTYVLSSGFYDAYYKRAQTVRTKLINEFNHAFSQVDILLSPTASTPAFKIGQNVRDPLQMYLTDIMTVAVNMVGASAISIPCGQDQGLPIGLQLIAPQKADRQLLGIAKAAEELLS
jgi:aspartyl-tRNA(Asn)/glutamyl-tRNA(Gln) amidotransferase subunit A